MQGRAETAVAAGASSAAAAAPRNPAQEVTGVVTSPKGDIAVTTAPASASAPASAPALALASQPVESR